MWDFQHQTLTPLQTRAHSWMLTKVCYFYSAFKRPITMLCSRANPEELDTSLCANIELFDFGDRVAHFLGECVETGGGQYAAVSDCSDGTWTLCICHFWGEQRVVFANVCVLLLCNVVLLVYQSFEMQISLWKYMLINHDSGTSFYITLWLWLSRTMQRCLSVKPLIYFYFFLFLLFTLCRCVVPDQSQLREGGQRTK